MTIFRFSFALFLGLLLSGCSSKEAFTCVGKTYDTREVGAPPLYQRSVTFVILDEHTLQRSDEDGRSPPISAKISKSDIDAVTHDGPNETRIMIDRVKGSGLETSKQGEFVFITSLADCKKSKAPDLEGKI